MLQNLAERRARKRFQAVHSAEMYLVERTKRELSGANPPKHAASARVSTFIGSGIVAVAAFVMIALPAGLLTQTIS